MTSFSLRIVPQVTPDCEGEGPIMEDVAVVLSAVRALLSTAEGTDYLCIERFEEWYLALKHDRVDILEAVLGESNVEEAAALLNNVFRFTESELKDETANRTCSEPEQCLWQSPFILTATFGAKRSFQAILKYKHILDVDCLENSNQNILHAIVTTVKSTGLGREKIYIDIYLSLMSTLSLHERRSLLMQENTNGMRPLEVAIRSGCFGLATAMFEEVGIYKFPKRFKGIYTEVWYDVTEYECWGHGSRRHVSPLQMLLFVETEQFKVECTQRFFEWDVIQSWTSIKFLMNLPFLLLWFLWRLSFCIMCYIIRPTLLPTHTKDIALCITEANATVAGHRNRLVISLPASIYMVVVAFGIVLVDLYELVKRIRQKNTGLWDLKKWHKYATHTLTYRLCQFTLAVSIITNAFQVKSVESMPVLESLLYTLASVINAWTLLYFFELTPIIGTYAICVQKLLGVIVRFMFLFAVMFFSFTITFWKIFTSDATPCPHPHFDDLPSSIYSTFQIMLNMIPNLISPDDDNMASKMFLHCLFWIIIAVMLLNFLVALMTNEINYIMEHWRISLVLQRLAAVLLTEQRINMFRLQFLHRPLQNRYFVRRKEKLFLRLFNFQTESAEISDGAKYLWNNISMDWLMGILVLISNNI